MVVEAVNLTNKIENLEQEIITLKEEIDGLDTAVANTPEDSCIQAACKEKMFVVKNIMNKLYSQLCIIKSLGVDSATAEGVNALEYSYKITASIIKKQLSLIKEHYIKSANEDLLIGAIDAYLSIAAELGVKSN